MTPEGIQNVITKVNTLKPRVGLWAGRQHILENFVLHMFISVWKPYTEFCQKRKLGSEEKAESDSVGEETLRQKYDFVIPTNIVNLYLISENTGDIEVKHGGGGNQRE